MENTRKSFLTYLLSFITVTLLISGIFAVKAYAEALRVYIHDTFGDFTYCYPSDASYGIDATITGYIGSDEVVEIPSNMNGHPVTSIGGEAFLGSDVKSVIIPNGVTSIGISAFEGCLSLESITIPTTVEYIGKAAFKDCGLKSITIPNGITSIEYETFQGCSNLESIVIPNSVTTIGQNAFYYCFGLKSVTLPDSVNFIDSFAFYSCYGLESLTIPKSVYTISDNAFNGCYSLKSLTISNGVNIIEEKAFANCDGLTSITIPDSVTSIGNEAFSGCNITSIYIPDNVAYIGKAPFSGLSEYKVSSSNANYCSIDGVLFDKKTETLVAYPSGKKGSAYYVPDTVISIGDNAFEGCSLTRIYIPDSVTSVGRDAFDFCWDLTDVYYSGSSSDWEKIVINEYGNDYLVNSTIHYNAASMTEIGSVVDKTPADNDFSANLPDVFDAAENIELTLEESTALNNGSTLSIVLQVTEASDEGKDAIKDKAASENLTIASFLDVSLFKQIDDNEPVAVTSTVKPIKVSFAVPDELIAEGREFFIIRTHGDETTVIECEFDAAAKTCTFETDKFFAYAIAYNDTAFEEPEPITAFVERLYLNILNRSSDGNKVTHIDNLNNGESACKVEYDFVFSSEFANLPISNEERVRRMYLTFLNREADPAGLADWTAMLDNGCSIGHIFYGFTQSDEFTGICESYGINWGTWECTENRDRSSKLTAFVSRLYTKAMDRAYDVNGLNDHTGSYLENHDLYQLAYNFIFSQEFIEKNLSDEDFVDVMYRTFFDREADPDGRADWLGRMKSGMPREDVLAGFVGSQECAELMEKFGI